MKTLYLIDGYAQFYRLYHAIRTPMTSPVTGEPTNMTYGFVGMLLKLLRGEGKVSDKGGGPDFVAVAIDVSGDRGTFRSQLYEPYKATRKEIPEDLPRQIARCMEILAEIGVPVVGSAGYEADDVIATMSRRLRGGTALRAVTGEQTEDTARRAVPPAGPDLRIRVISKDKDLKQLLDDGRFEIYDIHTDEVIDERGLMEQTGLRPGQVVDMLALMGDTVDNVPGVEGVGPKTAAQLIAQYGSLDALLAAVERDVEGRVFKGKRGERLREALPRLELSRRLVTLVDNVPVEFDLRAAEAGKLRVERLKPILRELGFRRYEDELDDLLKQRGGGEGRGGEGHGQADLAMPPVRAARASRAAAADGQFGLFEGLGGEGEGQARLGEPGHLAAPTMSGEYRCVRTLGELEELVAELRAATVVAVDTETTGLSPLRAELCGVAVSVKVGTGVYVPVRSPERGEGRGGHLDPPTVLEALRPVLEDARIAKVGHNLKFDLLVLRRAGVELRGVGCFGDAAHGHDEIGFDSMVASYLIDASRSSHSLDALCLALLGRTNTSLRDLIGSGAREKSFDCVPLHLAAPYAAEDVDAALQLREVMLPQLKAMGLMPLFRDVEMPLVEVLAELEWNGITVDPEELERQRERLAERLRQLRGQIDDAAYAALGRTFNPDSPLQLRAVLFNKPDDSEPGLGIKPLKRTKTGHSTDIEVLEKLAADVTIQTPIPALVVEHRQLAKLVGTYLVALRAEINPDTGRIHASFNQTVAATGRLSSSDPNLQNIPIRTDVGREIRKAFVAAPGHVLISADYSQIELRLLAHLSRDPALIDAFHQGHDIHRAVAAQIHGVSPEDVTREQRDGAKMVNFGIVYGITAYGLARRLGIGEREAGEIITGYKKRFAGITTFLQECVDFARRYGYVETMLKRRRPIPEIEARNPARRSLAERMAINSVVQGSAADLIKLAMVELHGVFASSGCGPLNAESAEVRAEGAGGRGLGEAGRAAPVKMLLQIHDELVFEAPEPVAEEARGVIVARMEGAMRLDVPIVAESAVSRDWFEGKG